MPLPRSRGRRNLVDYVIVRRSGVDEEGVVDDLEKRFDPTETVKQLLESPLQRRKSDSDNDSDDDDDDHHTSSPSATPIRVTMTVPQAQSTGGSITNKSPTETVVVELPPPPPERPPHRGEGISQTTEHLLIAAGSIGATIIVVMVVLAIYTMRKRGLSFSEAVQKGRYQVTRRGPPPPPKQATGWNENLGYRGDYGSLRNETVTPPHRAASINRSGSTSSQRPLMAMQRSDSFNSRQIGPERTVSPETIQHSYPTEPLALGRGNSHRSNGSGTPSSSALPAQVDRQSETTLNTRSLSDVTEQAYAEPSLDRTQSPLPPPPTFKQFMSNRPSASRNNLPMISRFSWTNSNAPQTPHDPYRDTNSQAIGRDSFMTQRSSVPRFRTVDSWVNQQANRIEAQKLKDQFRMTQTSTVYSGDEDRDAVPEVPTIPNTVNNKTNELAIPKPSTPATKAPLTPPPPPVGGLPGKNIKHERHDTLETAPIFRQHPGTEVRFSTRSEVPSEILDIGRKNTVL